MRTRRWLPTAGLWLAFTALLLVGVIFGATRRRHAPPPRPRLLAAFLDVGAGDCALLCTPDGRNVLVDAGPAAAGPLVAQTLRRRGIRSLDLLVLASPAPGSVGGVPALLGGGITVARAWEGATADTGAARQSALRALRRAGVPLETVGGGARFPFRGGSLLALWPQAGASRARADASPPDASPPDASPPDASPPDASPPDTLVCRLEYGRTRILLAGPADAATEPYLVADAGGALDCDVLQVTAGGADGGTSAEMLRRATPSAAVISCAASAPPGAGALHRLATAGAAVWRTDTQGAITVFSDGRGAPAITPARQ